jgi:hypothetical protein
LIGRAGEFFEDTLDVVPDKHAANRWEGEKGVGGQSGDHSVTPGNSSIPPISFRGVSVKKLWAT